MIVEDLLDTLLTANMLPALVLVLASLLPVAVPVFLPNAGDFVKAGYKQVYSFPQTVHLKRQLSAGR